MGPGNFGGSADADLRFISGSLATTSLAGVLPRFRMLPTVLTKMLPPLWGGPQGRRPLRRIRYASVPQARQWLQQVARQGLEGDESRGFHAGSLRSAAAANLDPNVAALLLDLGADANAESADGWTPVHGQQ